MDYVTNPVKKQILLARIHTHLTIRSLQTDLEDMVDLRTRELAQALGLIDSIIQSMPSILISLDHDGMITHWNHKAEDLTGIRRHKAVGQPVYQVFHHPHITPDRIRHFLATREPIREHRISIQASPRTSEPAPS